MKEITMDSHKSVSSEKSVEELKSEIAALEAQGSKGSGATAVVLFYGVLGLGALAYALYQDTKKLRSLAERDEKEKDEAEQKKADAAALLAKRTPEEKLLDALAGVQKSKAELEAAANVVAAQRETEAARKKAIDVILEAHKNGEDISRPDAWSGKGRNGRASGPKVV
jgi:uncharacterized protein HemX